MIKKAISISTLAATLALAGSAAAQPQNNWAHVGRKPLSDRAAAAKVTHRPEQRSMNVRANHYFVTGKDLRYFRSVKNSQTHQTSVQFNHWNKYVDGRSYLRNPSTDDLIQWAAHKWGIPENELRALAVFESNWQMDLNGDLAPMPSSWAAQYPRSAHSVQGPNMVYESIGIGQIKWTPDNADNPGTRYLRWKSTAFQLDYMAAEVRFFYDGGATWLGPSYHAGNQWLSLAAWNSSSPWNGPRQNWYVGQVKFYLAVKPWKSPNFVHTVFHRN